MLKIRLQRIGKRNQPKFRLVLIDVRKASKSGAFNEMLGFYDPKSKKIEIKKERINDWLLKGAKISPTALQIFKSK